MDTKRIQQFRESVYKEKTAEFLKKTQVYLSENQVEFVQEVQKQLEDFMQAICKGQEILPVPVGVIQISLLETSIHLGKPMLRMDAYDELGALGRRLFSKNYPCDWILTFWKDYEEGLVQEVDKLGAARFISRETIRVMMHETMEYLRAFLVGALKYPFAYADTFQGIDGFMREDDFAISFGSYMDWQKKLYADSKEVDIFYNPEDKRTDFGVYKNKIYKNKEFEKLDLSNSRFTECQFVNSHFKNVDLSDVIFDNCRFYQSNLTECTAYGLTMTNCILDTVEIEKTAFHYKGETDGNVKDIYKPLDIYDSQLQRVTFSGCDLEFTRGSNNEVIQLKLHECLTANGAMEELKEEAEGDAEV